MGFWSGVCDFVGSCVSGAIDVVSSAVSSVGSALASSASDFIKIASPMLNSVVSIVEIVGVFLNILNPNDNIEELGAKAMEADKKPEDFDSNAQYIDYLRDEIKLDIEKFEEATDIDKLARVAIGTTIVTKGIEEQKGFDIPLTTWTTIAKLNIDKPNEIDAIIDTFKNGRLDDFTKYSEGKLDTSKELEIGDSLVDMYSKLEPNLSKDEIEDKVMNMDMGYR